MVPHDLLSLKTLALACSTNPSSHSCQQQVQMFFFCRLRFGLQMAVESKFCVKTSMALDMTCLARVWRKFAEHILYPLIVCVGRNRLKRTSSMKKRNHPLLTNTHKNLHTKTTICVTMCVYNIHQHISVSPKLNLRLIHIIRTFFLLRTLCNSLQRPGRSTVFALRLLVTPGRRQKVPVQGQDLRRAEVEGAG